VATRRAAELAAAEARDRAEAASRAKSQFIANTSHELRTPLNGVLGMIALLTTTGLDEKQTVYARTIRQSGETLLALINDVLDYSKIAAGKLQLNHTEFELVSLVEDAVEVCAEPAHRKGLELVVEVPVGEPIVYTGDSARLRQVLINLVGNAVKFTSRGHVHVQITAEEISSQCTRLWFAVTDTGIGVARPDQAIIFEPFTQADGSSTRSFGGTGLGLTLCKQLVTLMGGDLGVHSVVGRGSTFSFAVIMACAKQNAAPTREAFRARRILLIDQQDLSRRVLAARLVALGMEVTEAGDLGGALRETANLTSSAEEFDLVIVDPQFAGPSPAAELVERLALSDVPVMHLTPLYEPPLTATRAPPRADITHLPKPVRYGQLLQALESALNPRPSDERATPSQVSTEPPQASCERSDSADGTIAAPSTNPLKVLLVEDNPVNQLVTSEMLRLFGCNVDVVDDGLQGLAKAKEFAYDIILMDCQMPNMDGFEATVAIRAWEQERNSKGSTPIIAVTANALATDRERCLAAGMNDYLSKPFGFADLKTALERWLPQELFAPNVARQAPALDIPELEELRSLGATDSQIADVARIYVESSSACLEDIASALEERNRDTLGKAAHKLRGAIGTIGTEMAATLCSRIRSDATTGSWATLTELRHELTHEIEVSNKRLSDIILGLSPEAQSVYFGDPERVLTKDEIESGSDQQRNNQRPAHGAGT
jgi:CheY-like chemotaxis protein/HPt (histidine-containing phosphotransfer) domain-containing protein